MLEDWLRYHGRLFGMENLFVLDGSDDPRVLAIYEKYKPFGLNVKYSSTGLNGLAQELTDYMHAYKGQDDFLIKVDTDEFLAWSKPIDRRLSSKTASSLRENFVRKFGGFQGIASKLAKRVLNWIFDRNLRNLDILNSDFDTFFQALPVNGKRYKAAITLWSIPKAGSSTKPAREITEFTKPQFTHLKSFFHSDSFVSVDLGCHVGKSADMAGFVDTGLVILHYHSVSVLDSVRRARQVLVSHEYIEQTDTADVEIKKLEPIKESKGDSFHKVDFYLQHLYAQKRGRSLDPEILNRQHPHYRDWETTQFNLVAETLEQIDSLGNFDRPIEQTDIEQ